MSSRRALPTGRKSTAFCTMTVSPTLPSTPIVHGSPPSRATSSSACGTHPMARNGCACRRMESWTRCGSAPTVSGSPPPAQTGPCASGTPPQAPRCSRFRSRVRATCSVSAAMGETSWQAPPAARWTSGISPSCPHRRTICSSQDWRGTCSSARPVTGSPPPTDLGSGCCDPISCPC
jgi:hypothetical protein